MGEKENERKRKEVELAVFKGNLLVPESEITIWIYKRYGFEDIVVKPIEIRKVHDFDLFLIITASTKYLVLNIDAIDDIKICELPDAICLSNGCEFYYSHLAYISKTNEKVDRSIRESEVVNRSFTRKYLPNLRVVKYEMVSIKSDILDDDTTPLYCLHILDEDGNHWCDYLYMI